MVPGTVGVLTVSGDARAMQLFRRPSAVVTGSCIRALFYKNIKNYYFSIFNVYKIIEKIFYK